MQKRSLVLAGHRTSLALEPEFWEALARGAQARKISLSQLVAEIDAERAVDTPERSLASACRVYALSKID